MSAKPQELGPPNVGAPPASTIPLGLRVLGMALRALFIGALVVVTVRVSHLFMLPKDAEGYRTWVYLGLVVAPLALALAIVLW